MKKARKVRFPAFERLSARAQALVIEGIEADLTQVQIIDKVDKEAGEKISSGSIGRFVENWRLQREGEKAADRYTEVLVKAVKDNEIEGTEIAQMAIRQGIFENINAAGSLDLETLLRLTRQYKELEIKSRSLDQTAEKIQLLERDVAVREQKLQQIGEQAEAAQTEISEIADLPEAVKDRIRSIYGLATQQLEAAA